MPSSQAGTELHFHALHGVDDGPQTLEESVELVRLAAADGTDTVVATPHVRSDFVTDVLAGGARACEELRAALALGGRRDRPAPGAELGHDMVGRLSQHELDADRAGPARRPLAAGRGAVRGHRRGLPRRHRRAARPRLLRARGSPGAQRRRRAGRLRRACAASCAAGLAGAGERPVDHRGPRPRRAPSRTQADRRGAGERGQLGRPRPEPAAAATRGSCASGRAGSRSPARRSP